MRYCDLNPVRAHLARKAGDWRWSSFRHYAFGEPDDLITDAPEYLALGFTAPARRRAYLHLFGRSLSEELLQRRADLVDSPFVGESWWVGARLIACGLSPPRPRSG
jgi:putative transposase